jgi:hypothetical protein
MAAETKKSCKAPTLCRKPNPFVAYAEIGYFDHRCDIAVSLQSAYLRYSGI